MKIKIRGWSKIIGKTVTGDWFCEEVIEDNKEYIFTIFNNGLRLSQKIILNREMNQKANIWLLRNDSSVYPKSVGLELKDIKDFNRFINHGLYSIILK